MDYKEDDIIIAEKMALQAKRVKVCLDPSPRVAIINNIANYNRLKFNLFNEKLREDDEPTVTMPGIYYNSLNKHLEMDTRKKIPNYGRNGSIFYNKNIHSFLVNPS